MICKYNDFIIENEFSLIINDIFLINEGKWLGDDTFDGDGVTYEWDLSTKKSSMNRLKTFLGKLSKEKIKEYFGKFLEKTKFLPLRYKKKVYSIYILIFLSFAPLTYLIPVDVDATTKKLIEITVETHVDITSVRPIPKLEPITKLEPLEVSSVKANLLDSIAWRESTNNPDTVNQFGYIGKYQFHDGALVDAGVVKTRAEAKIFREKFIKAISKDRAKLWSEKDQDEAMLKYMKRNKHYLRKYKNYVGTTINGIEITWSGLLAAAHLGGHRKVKKFLKSGGKTDLTDGNGNPVSLYMKKFGGYKLDV